MVGRQTELAVLREAFQAAVSGRQATLATVVGDAGAGKSRLLYEFENWLELLPRPVYYLAGRALSQRRGVPLALIRDVVAARFEIIDSDSSDVVFAKLVTAAAGVLEPLEVAVLGRWLGFDLGNAQTTDALSGEGLKLAGRAHLSTLLPTLAADAPVVLLLEDVHWADDDSVDVLGHLLTTLASTPMLVVATSRPDPSETPRRLEFLCPRATRVPLGALTNSETRALVVEILQQADEVPADLIDVIVQRAEGNPFYVEELVKMLIDDGIVSTDGPDGRWVIDDRHLDDSRVPATLTGVLQARLDALPDRARRSMQHASIIGRIFWDDAVSALGDGAAGLGPVATRELILPRHPSTFDACNEFIFKHALLHDVAYETVLLSDRPVLHGRAAAWLERTVGDRRDEFLIEIAEHRRRAGDLPGAAELLCVASEVALRSGSPQAARDLAERAVELSRAAEVASPRALTSLARTCRQLGQLTAAERAAREAIEAARDAAEDLLVDALYEGARLASALGEVVRAQELLEEALPIAERLGGAALCQVLVLMAWFANSTGDPAATLQIAERALRLATNTSNPELMTNAHMVHAAAVCELGDFDQAIAHGRAALEIVRSSGDIVGEAEQLLNVGVVWHLRGDADGAADHYRHAEAYYRMCLDLSGRLSLRERQSTALCNLAQVRIRLGDPDSAMALAREALSLAVEISALNDCLAAILFHADALIAIGDISTGLSHIGAVRRHPAVGYLSQEIDRILARLDTVGAEQLEEHLARGAHLTIDDIVMQIHSAHRPTNAASLTGPTDRRSASRLLNSTSGSTPHDRRSPASPCSRQPRPSVSVATSTREPGLQHAPHRLGVDLEPHRPGPTPRGTPTGPSGTRMPQRSRRVTCASSPEVSGGSLRSTQSSARVGQEHRAWARTVS